MAITKIIKQGVEKTKPGNGRLQHVSNGVKSTLAWDLSAQENGMGLFPVLKGKLTKTYHHLLHCDPATRVSFFGDLVSLIAIYREYYTTNQREDFIQEIPDNELREMSDLIEEIDRADCIIDEHLLRRTEDIVKILFNMFVNNNGDQSGHSKDHFVAEFEGIATTYKETPTQ